MDQARVRPASPRSAGSRSCRRGSCRCRRSSRPCAPRRTARRSSPARRAGRTGRSRSWARRGRTGWRGGRPSRRGRRACRCARTRTRPGPPGPAPAAASGACGRALAAGVFSSAQITYSSGRSRAALEAALVEVEHPAGLLGEARVADKDPGALLPRLQRVVVQPTPDRRGRRLAEAALDHQPVQLSTREAAKRQPVRRRQLARERFHLGDLLRGENGAGGPRARDPRARPGAPRRTASANGRRHPPPSPAAARSPCWSAPQPRTGSSSPEPPPCAAACNTQPAAPTRRAPRRSTRSRKRSSWPCHKIRRRRPGPFNDYRPNFGTRVLAGRASYNLPDIVDEST